MHMAMNPSDQAYENNKNEIEKLQAEVSDLCENKQIIRYLDILLWFWYTSAGSANIFFTSIQIIRASG